MTDLPTELAAEIARVNTKRESLGFMRYGTKGMARSIISARCALASGDTAAMKAALEDLKGYGDDH